MPGELKQKWVHSELCHIHVGNLASLRRTRQGLGPGEFPMACNAAFCAVVEGNQQATKEGSGRVCLFVCFSFVFVCLISFQFWNTHWNTSVSD